MNDIKRIQGKIIHLAPDGWGFISSIELEFTRIFFHWTGLARETRNFKLLEKNMRVEFLPIEVPGPNRGWRAIKITVIDDGRADTLPTRDEKIETTDREPNMGEEK